MRLYLLRGVVVELTDEFAGAASGDVVIES